MAVTQHLKMVVRKGIIDITREKIKTKEMKGTQDQDQKVALPFKAPDWTR